jgi:hypothetical protein
VAYKTREEQAAYARAWRAKNKDRNREYEKEYRKKRREEDPEYRRDYAKEYAKKWRAANPDKYRELWQRRAERIKNDPTLQERQRETQRRYNDRNRDKRRETWRNWAAEDRKKRPERHRAQSYKKLYGMTLEEYEQRAAAQSGRCAVCRLPPKRGRLHVDHDHLTDKLRDLLCHGCNTAIGGLGDDPARLRAAADYVERHRG